MNYKFLIVAAAVIGVVHGDPMPDAEFKYVVERPAFKKGEGPIVMVDEAHFNHHTATGRYLPFAELLRSDGYVVQSSKMRFGKDALGRGNILVIANALHQSNENYWVPPYPSAFTDEEIA